jgi:hypothetical protein
LASAAFAEGVGILYFFGTLRPYIKITATKKAAVPIVIH